MSKPEDRARARDGDEALTDKVRELRAMLAAAQGRAERVAEELDELVLPTMRPAAQLYRERRRRRFWFPEELFAEPAWDLLLYLYDAHVSGAKVPIKSAAHAAAVPASTALRWIKLLAGAGYLEPHAREGEERVAHLALTDKGRRAMEGYLSGVQV